jgi:hypothetical protein
LQHNEKITYGWRNFKYKRNGPQISQITQMKYARRKDEEQKRWPADLADHADEIREDTKTKRRKNGPQISLITQMKYAKAQR